MDLCTKGFLSCFEILMYQCVDNVMFKTVKFCLWLAGNHNLSPIGKRTQACSNVCCYLYSFTFCLHIVFHKKAMAGKETLFELFV